MLPHAGRSSAVSPEVATSLMSATCPFLVILNSIANFPNFISAGIQNGISAFPISELWVYLTFALNFAHLARWAAAIRARAVFETPYTVGDVAKLTGFSVQTIIRIFAQERGVLIYEPKRTRKRASYRSIRIPRHVYRRVLQKLTLQ